MFDLSSEVLFENRAVERTVKSKIWRSENTGERSANVRREREKAAKRG